MKALNRILRMFGLEATPAGETKRLAEAIRLTHEYVGYDLLPPRAGWAWYDALEKHLPRYVESVRMRSER